MKKKKILFISNISFLKTGYGRHNKELLTELYKTGKYEIVEYGTGGVRKNDPILNRLPWKAYGSWPNNDAELEPILNNFKPEERQQVLMMIGHGWLYVDEIVKLEQPDAIVVLEDIWQVDWLLAKEWWNKIPCFLHTPVDSLPILKIFTDNKDKLTNLWVKAEFAVKALKEKGLDAKFIPAFMNHNDFHPIKESDRKAIRKLYGLEDTFVIGKVSRNQLRKLFPHLMEGFKIFKSRNPDAKAKLLFHTNMDEPGGWRIDEERERLGLDKADILSTYICSNCKGIRIAPYAGQKLPCDRCRTPDSVINPTIAIGVTEEELNAIYNVMDCMVHVATSGGFEMTMLEGMLAGLPTATCPYSFGEMFVDSGFCEPIKFNYFREGISQFYKSNPDVNNIADIIEKMYNNQSQYKEIGLKGREWALEKFKPSIYIDQIQDMIDNSVNEYQSTEDNIDKNVSIAEFIKESGKKKLLYIMPGSAEDCFVSLSVIEAMESAYPRDEWDYYVSSSKEYMEIFEQLDIVNFIPYHPKMDDFRFLEGHGSHSGYFDLVFHPYAQTSRFISYHRNGLDVCNLQQ